MNRAEMRRQNRENTKKKTATYCFTEEQLDAIIQEKVGKAIENAKKEASEEALNNALMLLFTLPMEVLMDHFWKKSYERYIPKFCDLLLEYYYAWENDELDMEKMREDLWVYGNVRLEVREEEAEKS